MTDTPMPPAGEPGDDTVAYGAEQPPTYGTTPEPRRGSRRGIVIGATAAAIAVVAGVAVYATTTLSGGGRQPDELVPRSTFAYLKVDLDPAANQKLAARSFFGKFPKLKGGSGAENPFEGVLSSLVNDDDVSYETDIKPWFDKRAAVAAFPGGDGKTNVVAVFQSKDDGKAKAALDKAAARAKADGGDGAAYRITKGYVVVSDSQAAVDASVTEAEKASLRDNPTYRNDVDKLDGDQVAIGWTDIAQAFDAAKGSLPIPIALPGGLSGQVKGRLVAGVHLTGDYVEMQGRILGSDPRLNTGGSKQPLLTGLPKDTAVAASFANIGKGLAAGDTGSTLAPYLEGSGLTFEDDILPLFGSDTLIAAAPFTSLEDLRVGLVSKVTDKTKAEGAVRKVSALLGALGTPASATIDGDTVYIASPGAYTADLKQAGGGLGSVSKFRTAMGDLGGTAAAMYVDLDALQRAFPTFGENAEPLTAFGLVSGYDDGESFFRARLVAS